MPTSHSRVRRGNAVPPPSAGSPRAGPGWPGIQALGQVPPIRGVLVLGFRLNERRRPVGHGEREVPRGRGKLVTSLTTSARHLHSRLCPRHRAKPPTAKLGQGGGGKGELWRINTSCPNHELMTSPFKKINVSRPCPPKRPKSNGNPVATNILSLDRGF